MTAAGPRPRLRTLALIRATRRPPKVPRAAPERAVFEVGDPGHPDAVFDLHATPGGPGAYVCALVIGDRVFSHTGWRSVTLVAPSGPALVWPEWELHLDGAASLRLLLSDDPANLQEYTYFVHVRREGEEERVFSPVLISVVSARAMFDAVCARVQRLRVQSPSARERRRTFPVNRHFAERRTLPDAYASHFEVDVHETPFAENSALKYWRWRNTRYEPDWPPRIQLLDVAFSPPSPLPLLPLV